MRQPRELRLLQHADHGVLEQLSEVVQVLTDEGGDAQVKRNGDRLLARHLRERLVREEEQRVGVELVGGAFDLVVRNPRPVEGGLHSIRRARRLHVLGGLVQLRLARLDPVSGELDTGQLAENETARLRLLLGRVLRRGLTEGGDLVNVLHLMRHGHLDARERHLVKLVLEVLDEGLEQRHQVARSRGEHHERLQYAGQLMPELALVQVLHLRVLAGELWRGGGLGLQEAEDGCRLCIEAHRCRV
mmetsp:Transcript_38072/g.89520  ORF Transcript_38072/g.89520 Transcript_38072/m.89520 type:complete len:245 (-) Transcript_38072:72-806(-)